MTPTFSIFKSRTFWSIIAMFIVGGGNAIVPVISPSFSAILSAALGMLAAYYHINPSQDYNQGSIKH